MSARADQIKLDTLSKLKAYIHRCGTSQALMLEIDGFRYWVMSDIAFDAVRDGKVVFTEVNENGQKRTQGDRQPQAEGVAGDGPDDQRLRQPGEEPAGPSDGAGGDSMAAG